MAASARTPRTVASRTAARPARASARQRSGAHALAGFTIGVLAVSVGFLFAGTEPAPNAASEAAARAAAVRIALDPDARPSAEPPPAAAHEAPSQRFAASSPLFSPQSATRVVIRSVGIDATVRPVGYVYQQGRLEYDVPRVEAGEYVTGAQVGKRGNAVIGGHVSRRGAPGVFARLPQVSAGDVVEVYRGDQVFRYSVTEIRVVAPDATSVMSQTHDATLTLITCFPDEAFQDRLVVRGRLL
ncbi:MAG: sortase [Dehalococcoidia bacterium]